MKKIVLIPDSFKGTMSSTEICQIMTEAIRKFSDAEVMSIPVADGGEGSVDAFISAVGGEKVFTEVSGPYFEKMQAFYGLIHNGRTAVIEMAVCAGLPLVTGNADPMKTTTYGVGELIKHALQNGCRDIILCLGGSCTNDAGAGLSAALGVKYENADGKEFIPVGGTLKDIAHIDIAQADSRIKDARITVMCDIDNPLYGEEGAAYVFGPQKGADNEAVVLLDNGLRHYSKCLKNDFSKDVSDIPGTGAAGGIGASMIAFFNAELKMGIETVLETVNFSEIIKDADFVISGEGKIDSQSLRGKVVIGVAKETRKQNVPLIAVVGDIGDNIESAYDMGVSAVFSINRVAVDFTKAKTRAKEDLRLTVENIIRFVSTIKS